MFRWYLLKTLKNAQNLLCFGEAFLSPTSSLTPCNGHTFASACDPPDSSATRPTFRLNCVIYSSSNFLSYFAEPFWQNLTFRTILTESYFQNHSDRLLFRRTILTVSYFQNHSDWILFRRTIRTESYFQNHSDRLYFAEPFWQHASSELDASRGAATNPRRGNKERVGF